MLIPMRIVTGIMIVVTTGWKTSDIQVQIRMNTFCNSYLIDKKRLKIQICLLQKLFQRRMFQNAWNIEHQAKEHGGQDIGSHQARQAYSYYPGAVQVGRADSL
jgi:hypothetical protein